MSKEFSKIAGGVGSLVNKGIIGVGTVTLSTPGGVQIVQAPGVEVGDVVQVTLKSDDTGLAITKILAVAGAGQITITRTDDVASNDDGVVQIVAFKPEDK